MKQKQIIREKGQVVLMVLLASALILTLGLSASRITTTETKIDTDQELLKKAFNAAESGIDYYLATGDTNYSANESGSASLEVAKLGEVNNLSFNSMTLVGDYDFFWLVNHDETTNELGTDYYSDDSASVKICSSNKKKEVFKVDYFYKEGSNYRVERVVLEFGDDGCSEDFDIARGGSRQSLLLTVTPIDSPTKLELRGGAAFPVQGQKISATGKIEGVNNTVTVLNRYDVLLTEGIVAGGSVTSSK